MEAALADWIRVLDGYTADQIEAACQGYLRANPKRRPTPADVRDRISSTQVHREGQQDKGDQTKLSPDEYSKLHNEILPTARRWTGIPALKEHGFKTLDYWGEQ